MMLIGHVQPQKISRPKPSTERKNSVTPIKIYKELLAFCAQVTKWGLNQGSLVPESSALTKSYHEPLTSVVT